jgi:uncharacterized DUF497 family protein
MREDNIRIISVRRCRKNEKEILWKKYQQKNLIKNQKV